MNIFVTSECPIESARNLDNVRRNKMLLETCQLLSTALNAHGVKGPYRSTHMNHPATIWARQNKGNYQWLLDHAQELATLYTIKTGKIHKCSEVLPVLRSLIYVLPDGPRTPFVNCARNKEKGIDYTGHGDVTLAYQLYLNDRWETDSRPPTWG